MSQSLEQKRQRLAELLKQKTGQRFPLSFAQQRLWFLEQLQPGQTVYVLPAAFRLSGKLDVIALHRSLNAIVERHEILRSSFSEVNGKPSQTVIPRLSLDLPVVDCTEQEVEAQLKAFVAQPFDLTQAPLLRVVLLRLNPTEHILLFALHHIIADYWSMRVLIQELTSFYDANAPGGFSPLSPLPIQYADYAVWQQNWLQSDAKLKQLDYWKQQLAHPTQLQLPTDFPRPSLLSFRGATQSFTLSTDLTQSLKQLSHQYQTTLYMTLLAAFKVLLHRYTGQIDVLIGSTIANRTRPELTNLIGLFTNNLVFRTQIDGRCSFRDVLQQVREVTLNAYEHQDLPFEYLVEQIQPERDLSQNPLFQVMFVLHNTPSSEVALSNLTLQYIQPQQQTTRFDLSLDMDETLSGLTGVFEYSTDLFRAETIDRLITHFKTLLTSVVEQPHEPIAKLPLLSEVEQAQFLEWQGRDRNLPQQGTHHFLEAQAIQSPHQIAITFEQTSWTYQQLNQHINQLAHYLLQSGVSTGSRVGVCLERSLSMVVTLLAVLKTGAAYVPIDPTYPVDRITFVLKDAQVSHLITCSQWDVDATIIDLEASQDKISQQSTQNPQVTFNLAQLAYIIYTSGSTGTPKGVQVQHCGLVNVLTDLQHRFQITSRDRLLAVTTIAFDIAVLELFLPLMAGAEVILASRETAIDAEQLAIALETDQITLMQATPATWRMLIAQGWQGSRSLQIFCGGEALSSDLAKELLLRGKALWNLYGPTETTIWSAAHRLESGDAVSIGQPISNTHFYVLDDALNLLPIGVSGQLYIGGAGVAQGYWQRPDLTSERFIESSYGRIYQTGDRVRWRSDGTLEYLGRNDHQVKLRGYRIELGEIEVVLQQYPTIAQAVVILQAEQLVAYTAPIGNREAELRQFLAKKLPGYMIPAMFVELDQMPLTPNGKLDRRALPTFELQSRQSEIVEPRTAIEKALVEIWTALLKRSPISVTDDFFELGGHSLLATQVVSQIRQRLEIELPLRDLFEASRLEALAQVLETIQKRSSKILPNPNRDSYPLSFAQQRLWVLAQLEPDSPFYNIPLTVRVRGTLDPAILQRSFSQVIQRHHVLRSRFKTHEGQAVQVIAEATLDLSVIDLSERSEPERSRRIEKLIKAEAQHPFDIANDLLIRVHHIQIQKDDQFILVTLHHIVADAWSMGVLVQEVAQLYQSYQQNIAPSLPELSIQYADFAAWQQEQIQGEILHQHLNYWHRQLSGAPVLLELPTDRLRPAIQTFQGAVLRFLLPPELSNQVKQLSQKSGNTTFMILLAAFNILLHRYTGSKNIVVGSPIANRTHAETESLIGCFTNTLALHTSLAGDPSAEEVLQQVRDVALGAYAHQDLPFEQVIDALQIERSLSHTPLFQVMLVLQNTPLPEFSADHLQWNVLEVDSGTAKFDITLTFTETELGLQGKAEYNTDLFDQSTISRLCDHFSNILQAVLETPQQRISQLPLLCDHEYEQISQWNQTQKTYSSSCIHHLFEAQAVRSPNLTAVIHESSSLTYTELNEKSNQLAHCLQQLDIQPDGRVGICLDRSCDLLIGLLGILKSGGAYIPLDPAYPAERLAFTMRDAQIQVLVTQRSLISHLPTLPIPVIYLDDSLEEFSSLNPTSFVQPSNLAYIIYTSGSTGVPKGVAIAHQSTTALVHWAQEIFTSKQLKGVLASTSICFDLSVFELFLPLCSGGTVILAENALQLPELSAAHSVTLINTVPSAIRELLRSNSIPSSVRVVNLAGEALPLSLVHQLYEQTYVDAVYNLYGPSEDTTYSTIAHLPKTIAQTPPIGRPISNTQAYVLDAHLQPVPMGVIGELYLGGEGLARCYWNRPDLSAEKFVPNPFSSGKRLYKTGDRARYLPTGELEFLGRIDHQIKLRGFRIELGEVEFAIEQHPEIETAIAILNDQLVAYFTANRAISSTELRQFLAAKLPAYMLPSSFVFLEKMPLTPNGKVDRAALPSSERIQLTQYTAPRTAEERQLVEIWQQVLGRQPIGIDDNFFELGGDSILAIQAISKANQAGLSLTPRQVFQAQTIAELAILAGTGSTISIEQEVITGVVPLTPIQHWFFAQNFSEPHHWNQSVLLHVKVPLNLVALKEAIQALLVHHDNLRSQFELTSEGWQQFQVSPNLAAPVVQVDISDLDGSEREHTISAVANSLQSSLVLGSAPLMRVAYFSAENQGRLLIILHHLIIDGVSWRILLEDLQTAYYQVSQLQSIQLPAKTTSLKSWMQQLEANLLETDKTYWMSEVWQSIKPIPVDDPHGRNTIADMGSMTIALSHTETQSLLSETFAAYHTQINDLLLTALAYAFQEWTNEPQLLIELEGHGREESRFESVDLSRTIGWFTSLFLVLLDLSATDSFSSAIRQIKEQLRQASERGMNYGELKYLRQEDISIQPQVRFNYLGQVDTVLTESDWFSFTMESSGYARSPNSDRAISIEINSIIQNGQLRLNWTYSKAQYAETTIKQLTESYLDVLRSLIQHCLTQTVESFTPSDFPQMDFSQAELDDLLADL
jgi:amino acid adenylation domain-containing protein/non-ribosomal peptide synthase protein (TIGR01720 family)